MKEAPKALIVEHDEAIRKTLTLAMESLGCTAMSVESGSDALEAIGGQVFAVALIESRLPGALSGSETLEAIKLQLPSLPVVLLGEPDRPNDMLAAFHAGAADVLLKPFELAELRAALARALVQQTDEAAIAFHGRLELAKTALASAAFDVAGAHLRAALGQNPLDAETLNLYGVARELSGDVETATQAYRAAFACDPNYARARENLERASDQFAFIGLFDDARIDLFQATAARIAVPIFDPVRDLPLCRLAKLIGGSSIGVAVGVLLDPPTEETAAKTIARRRGFVRPAGRGLTSVPCMIDYTFATDRVAAARKLREDEKCDLTVLGEWLPETVRAGILEGGALAVTARGELGSYDALLPESGDEIALGIAVNLALAAHGQVLVSASLMDALKATTVPVHALFAQAKLQRPRWVQSEVYVSVRAAEVGLQAITIGSAEGSTLRISDRDRGSTTER